jgi:hypothetical protein
MTSDTSMDALLDNFVERVADAVVVRLGAAAMHPRPVGDDEPVDEPTMAEMAKVSAQSLARPPEAGRVPHIQCGRRVLYRPAAVLAALSCSKEGGDA